MMAINDLIPGSLSWMLFNMSRVHPVYDASVGGGAVLTDELVDILTDEFENILTAESGGTVLTLVRWD